MENLKLHTGNKESGGYDDWIFGEDNLLAFKCSAGHSMAQHKEHAQELVRRWNSQPALLAACERLKDYWDIPKQWPEGTLEEIIGQVRTAIAAANPK